jgi:hypothetical protein
MILLAGPSQPITLPSSRRSHLVKADLFHLGGDARMTPFLPQLSLGNGDHVPQEPGHIGLIALCRVF